MTSQIRQFILSQGPSIHCLAWSLARNEDDAHDLIQESLRRVIKRWDRYDCSRPLLRWFATVMRNTYLDERKSARRRLSLPLEGRTENLEDNVRSCLDTLPDGGEESLDNLLRKEEASLVSRTLRQLPPKHRKILILRELNDMSYAEVAHSLRLPLGTVRSRISRAREMFRKQFSRIQKIRGKVAGHV